MGREMRGACFSSPLKEHCQDWQAKAGPTLVAMRAG